MGREPVGPALRGHRAQPRRPLRGGHRPHPPGKPGSPGGSARCIRIGHAGGGGGLPLHRALYGVCTGLCGHGHHMGSPAGLRHARGRLGHSIRAPGCHSTSPSTAAQAGRLDGDLPPVARISHVRHRRVARLGSIPAERADSELRANALHGLPRSGWLALGPQTTARPIHRPRPHRPVTGAAGHRRAPRHQRATRAIRCGAIG